MDYNRAMPKLERAMRRELRLWLKLRHLNIVPLLGIAHVESPWPALVYPWMPSGTLYVYLEKQATTLSASAKFGLVKGVADGLHYLHSNNVVHGDLQPANILIDNSGNPCLTGFGLATIVEDPELQWNSTTAARDFNSRWRAPEVIGIESDEPARPTFTSDIYSFGSVIFFIISGDIPWKEKKNLTHIVIELSRGATPGRPENMPNGSWNLIERCWSRDPMDRPETARILDYTDQCRIDNSQVRESHQSAYLVAEQVTPSVPRNGKVQSQSPSRSLVASPSQPVPFTTRIHHSFSRTSTLSTSGPLNVLLFGETGVGKSSVINLIMGQGVAETSPRVETCTLVRSPYEINLGTDRFKLWEVSSIESMGFLRTFFKKLRLKRSYKKLYKDDGVYLLLYCMRGSKAQRALVNNYKFFTDVVGSTAGRVPVAAVVTSLEDYPENMDNWWTNNEGNLGHLGMRFSAHACITSLPDDPKSSLAMRARRQQSEQAIRCLLYESYQAGRTPVSSNMAST
ncbi:kinase-like domain-containing protein [Suillus subaureus]|uniref:Kinase-like domain-containing protein n=1 Tax=Suillus subaureus TaxID=48587 RepID=A0A9P7E6W6_9AGAM|nr:kinase-like domain-containing protein [Suillus subaureus]KAG1812482.1 kinase-like domain-containing protein [Suillus subaureus]